tara:strand:- start:20143 stop:20550 length:408 start_codon:yes stop_codon:yes gene_type:complete
MNTKNRYLIYILYFLLTIPAVIFIFKSIEPKQLASLFAAGLFITCSLLPIWGEIKNKTKTSFVFYAAIGFLVLFSLPMITVRILNYGTDFSQLYVGPLTGPEFHKYSNYGFIILLCSSIVDFIQSKWIHQKSSKI